MRKLLEGVSSGRRGIRRATAYFGGVVDEVAIYGTVLSPEQIAAHCAAARSET
jgi:hypothetical protein